MNMIRQFVSSAAMSALLLGPPGLSLVTSASAADFEITVPVVNRGSNTYYLDGVIEGLVSKPFLVDTGASYLTINEQELALLMQQGKATYLRDLSSRLADGSRRKVPLYRLSAIRLGDHCELYDVEAAVLSGSKRSLLGLNVLRRISPFIFAMDPPRLILSNCRRPAPTADHPTAEPQQLSDAKRAISRTTLPPE